MRLDKVRRLDFDGADTDDDSCITSDLTFSYALTDHLQLSAGSTNLFNRCPAVFNPPRTETGGAWDPAQMGANGRFYFAKLQARF